MHIAHIEMKNLWSKINIFDEFGHETRIKTQTHSHFKYRLIYTSNRISTFIIIHFNIVSIELN